MLLTDLRYHSVTYAEEIAIITTAPSPVAMSQNIIKAMIFHAKQAPAYRILSVPHDTYDCHLLITNSPRYSTEVLYILGWLKTQMGYLF